MKDGGAIIQRGGLVKLLFLVAICLPVVQYPQLLPEYQQVPLCLALLANQVVLDLLTAPYLPSPPAVHGPQQLPITRRHEVTMKGGRFTAHCVALTACPGGPWAPP